MLIYFGETVTVQIEGHTWREEKCHHCGGQFHYQLRLVATGAAINPYFLDSYGAPRHAEAAARSRLAYDLKRFVLPVPCPHCLKYQDYMVPTIRANRLRWMRTAGHVFLSLGGLILSFSLLIAFLIFDIASSRPAPNVTAALVMFGTPVLPLATGTGLIMARRRLLASHDPNADVYAPERQQIANECALTPEEFAKLRIPLTPPGLARLGSPPQSRQLVGTNCVRCGQRISNELDSGFCRGCGWPIHNRCAVPAEGGCPLCGAGAPPSQRT